MMFVSFKSFLLERVSLGSVPSYDIEIKTFFSFFLLSWHKSHLGLGKNIGTDYLKDPYPIGFYLNPTRLPECPPLVPLTQIHVVNES